MDSIYTIWDEHSREPNLESDGYVNESAMSDLYVLMVTMHLIIALHHLIFYCIIRSIVPEICDLDVATINALVDSHESVETVNGTDVN